MYKTAVIFILSIVLLTLSCAKKSTEAETEIIKDYQYDPVKVGFISLYMNQSTLYNQINYQVADDNGVPLFSYNSQLYYHPVMIGHRCLYALSDFYNNQDSTYLDFAKKAAQALVDRSTRLDDKIYFPYHFDYNPWATTITYTAPWYSGMAQGVMLSALSRLYYLTNDDYYKALADSVLNTFTEYDHPMSTVYISKNEGMGIGEGYFWVDEYPHDKRRFVLNGSISGAFGLYDYWWVFGDEKAKKLFSMEMTSIKDHVMLYRNPGKISYYCLLFKDQSAYYHALHQTLLNCCFLYTNDLYFSAVSYLLFSDYH